MNAFLFPGQGSQYVGMGKELCDKHAVAREVFEQADAILGFELSKLCFEGPEDELKKTLNTQPALFVKSYATLTVIRDRLSASFVAGHSLGEYSALAAAGALTFEDGLRAVRKRGELMWESGTKRPGTMAAILGLSTDQVESLCEEASSAGVVQPANLNCPGQIVVSGEVAAVEKAVELAPAAGAKKAQVLNVSGAFHSALMEDAQAELAEFLESISFEDASIPVVANVNARPEREGSTLRKQLVQQMTSPVRWEESMRFLVEEGVDSFYEVGPGRVLRGLMRSIDRGAACKSIGPPKSLEEILAGAEGGVA